MDSLQSISQPPPHMPSRGEVADACGHFSKTTAKHPVGNFDSTYNGEATEEPKESTRLGDEVKHCRRSRFLNSQRPCVLDDDGGDAHHVRRLAADGHEPLNRRTEKTGKC